MRDEALIAWKVQLIFKVYLPYKPDSHGIKPYLVSESKSGYMCNVEVYIGKLQPAKIWV
jgi:hypothetical protein